MDELKALGVKADTFSIAVDMEHLEAARKAVALHASAAAEAPPVESKPQVEEPKVKEAPPAKEASAPQPPVAEKAEAATLEQAPPAQPAQPVSESRPPVKDRPTTGERPPVRPGERPSGAGRPGERPTRPGERPTGRPGDRPAGASRPTDRPTRPGRPTGPSRPGERPPGRPGDRPTGPTRPGGAGRPGGPAGAGRPGDRPARPAGPGGRPSSDRPARPDAVAAAKPGAKPPTKRSAKPGDKSRAGGVAARDKAGAPRKPQQDIAREVFSGRPPRPRRSRRSYKVPKQQIVEISPELVEVPEEITVQEFAQLIKKPASDLVLMLMEIGNPMPVTATIDSTLAEEIGRQFDITVVVKTDEDTQRNQITEAQRTGDVSQANEEDLVKRSPVVTVMGHVDHGKTTLLDSIRNTKVAEGEAGGITQSIGASEIEVEGERIVFIDTPGHEAFTQMRARGAMVTDIVVLVVAADDGVRPQTIEAIDHAKAAKVPIIVAINKIDAAGANPDRVKSELAEYGLNAEDWGGTVPMVSLSAKTGERVSDLLDIIQITAEMEELKGNPTGPARGVVIEAGIDTSQGALATIIVKQGTLSTGDMLVSGTAYGRVRSMVSASGRKLDKAGPSTAVQVSGLNDVPAAGELVEVVASPKEARALVEARMEVEKQARAARHITLEELRSKVEEGVVKALPLVLKARDKGMLDALENALSNLPRQDIRVEMLHLGVGNIADSDVHLAAASDAIVLGFGVRVDGTATKLAETEGVQIRTYDIIYHLIEDLRLAMEGMLTPEVKEIILGHAEVRALFSFSRVGTIAGCYVVDGVIRRNNKVRVKRKDTIVAEGDVTTLKHIQEDRTEIRAGFECGITMRNFDNFEVGDIIECFELQESARRL